jgi:hypothetical protein
MLQPDADEPCGGKPMPAHVALAPKSANDTRGDQDNGQGTKSRDRDYFTTRVRTELQIDTRTQTDYGVLRTYANPRFQFDTGANAETGVITLDFAFVQFAGFTLGKAVSAFQTPWGSSVANSLTSFLIGGYDNINGITQFAYTWQFGNGVSAQAGVEDNRTIVRGQLLNASLTQPATGVFTGAFTNSHGGNAAPDIVGNVRIDNTAFTAQLSAAAHDIHAWRLPAQLVAELGNRNLRQLFPHRVQRECDRGLLRRIHSPLSEVERLYV